MKRAMASPYSLLAQLESVKDKPRPPIHLWNPGNVKDIDMEIRRDGTWYYQGTPIERVRLARLFSTVLRREDDGEYYLVTPVEKCRIRVEDVPFFAVLMEASGEGRSQQLQFTTSVGDDVCAGEAHPIRISVDDATGEPSPYVMVRDGLEALMSRSVYYQLADLLVEEVVDDSLAMGVWSDGAFFSLATDWQAN